MYNFTKNLTHDSFKPAPSGTIMWEVQLDAVSEDGPFTITASSNGCDLTLDDILFGDVWVCSGQSNMVHRLDNVSQAVGHELSAIWRMTNGAV